MKQIFLFSFLIFFNSYSLSQVVHEPLHNDVYNYLHRLSQKGIITFNDVFKPLPRKYISEKLLEAGERIEQLTNLEKEELDFFKRDYFIETSQFSETSELTGFFEKDSLERFRLFYYKGPFLKVNASPILGYKIELPEKDRNTYLWNGMKFFGYLPGNIGFDFNFRITNEKGNSADRFKSFTPATGIIRINNIKSFNYNEVNSMLSIDWGWGNAVIAKEFLEYGYAKSGKLILSNKAPSYPFILLQINPADWINFYWFHAWLSSNVFDSVQIAEYKRNIYHDKYFAWHSLIITPLKGLDISIGESIVYSDKLEFIYLMPLMFYFLAEDFISHSRNQPGDANTQFFLSVSSKNHLKNTHIYGTLFVDELTLRGISGFIIPDNPGIIFDHNRTQFGFSTGISLTDIPLNNLTSTIEYTKIYPFVYGHHTPAQTYTNSSYLMGHWMGHNSDLLHLELNYRFLRGLQVNVWGEYIRKGSSSFEGQYTQRQPVFLFGPKNYYTYFGINLNYEVMHELNAEIGFRSDLVRREVENNLFLKEQLNEFSFSLYYGM